MKRMMLCIATVLLLSGCGQTQPETDRATLQQSQFIQAARAPAEELDLPDVHRLLAVSGRADNRPGRC